MRSLSAFQPTLVDHSHLLIGYVGGILIDYVGLCVQSTSMLGICTDVSRQYDQLLTIDGLLNQPTASMSVRFVDMTLHVVLE